MIRHASALMITAALMTGPAVLLTAPPAFAVAPTAAEAAPGTTIYGADGSSPVAKVVDVFNNSTGTTFLVLDVTNLLGEKKMVTRWIGNFNYENGKVLSHYTRAQVQAMPAFDYNVSMGGGGH